MVKNPPSIFLFLVVQTLRRVVTRYLPHISLAARSIRIWDTKLYTDISKTYYLFPYAPVHILPEGDPEAQGLRAGWGAIFEWLRTQELTTQIGIIAGMVAVGYLAYRYISPGVAAAGGDDGEAGNEPPQDAPQPQPQENEAPQPQPQENEAPQDARQDAPLEARQEAPQEPPQPQHLDAPQINIQEARQDAPQPQHLEAPQINAPQPQPQHLEAPQINIQEARQDAPQPQHLEAPQINAPQPQPQHLEAPQINIHHEAAVVAVARHWDFNWGNYAAIGALATMTMALPNEVLQSILKAKAKANAQQASGQAAKQSSGQAAKQSSAAKQASGQAAQQSPAAQQPSEQTSNLAYQNLVRILSEEPPATPKQIAANIAALRQAFELFPRLWNNEVHPSPNDALWFRNFVLIKLVRCCYQLRPHDFNGFEDFTELASDVQNVLRNIYYLKNWIFFKTWLTSLGGERKLAEFPKVDVLLDDFITMMQNRNFLLDMTALFPIIELVAHMNSMEGIKEIIRCEVNTITAAQISKILNQLEAFFPTVSKALNTQTVSKGLKS
jgi:hypothetical protein